jgi:putative FmdB family regulatory protein
MPFYEYECRACKFYTEVMQKITEAPLSKCPSCGKRALSKLLSAPVFRLKGAGWYETDFKSEKESKRNLSAVEKEEPKPQPQPKPQAPEGKTAADTAAATKDTAPAAAKTAAADGNAGAHRGPARKATRASRARRTRSRRRRP